MTEQNEGLLVAPMVTFNLELSSHQKYLMKVQRDADHEHYKAQLAKVEQHYHPSIEAQKLQIELAKREERERIIDWGVEPCPHWQMYPDVRVIKRDCSQCWQDLKGG